MRIVRSPSLKLMLLAIRPGSTPAAWAASSTVAEEVSNSRIRSARPKRARWSRAFSNDMWSSCFRLFSPLFFLKKEKRQKKNFLNVRSDTLCGHRMSIRSTSTHRPVSPSRLKSTPSILQGPSAT